MLLSEPKNSKLVKPNLKVEGVHQRKDIGKEKAFVITLSSKAVAPFVWLDFKKNSGIKGQFIENGFFVFSDKRDVLFETNETLTEQHIKDNLIIKTVTDVL